MRISILFLTGCCALCLGCSGVADLYGGDMVLPPPPPETVAVAHGALFVQIKEEPIASQPPPLAEGAQTAILPRTRVVAEEGEDKLLVVPKGVSLGEVVNALNSIGVTPRDLIAILLAIKASGALHAELEII